MVFNFLKLWVGMLTSNPTYFEFMTILIGLILVSLTWVSSKTMSIELPVEHVKLSMLFTGIASSDQDQGCLYFIRFSRKKLE